MCVVPAVQKGQLENRFRLIPYMSCLRYDFIFFKAIHLLCPDEIPKTQLPTAVVSLQQVTMPSLQLFRVATLVLHMIC